MEVVEEMTPVVRPVLSVFDENSLAFVTGVTLAALDQTRLEQYLLHRRVDRPNLNAVPVEPLVQQGVLKLSRPDHSKSPKQTYTAAIQ